MPRRCHSVKVRQRRPHSRSDWSPMRCWNLFLRAAFVLLAVAACLPADACTTAVISGRATADGRPLLWKNRDTSTTRRNEVDVYDGERYRVLAVFNAGKRNAVWMGVNSAGFCIENALSRDLGTDEETSGPGNGGLMKIALETCATVEEFRALLERTNESGRATEASFGVIDAQGGAAVFETGATSYQMFDANDPEVAPQGYLVRSNFATTARGIEPLPEAAAVAGTYSAERYARGCQLVEGCLGEELSVGTVVRRFFRDLADTDGSPFPGSVNGPAGSLPPVVDTSSTISRTTTVSAAVFHGVRPGEDPLQTTMWVALGDPKFSIAVPCWVGIEEPAGGLAGEHGGPIGAIANTLREWNLTRDRSGVLTAQLPQIWSDVWPVENRLLEVVAEARDRWGAAAPDPTEITELHESLAAEALLCMQGELADMKAAALALPAPSAAIENADEWKRLISWRRRTLSPSATTKAHCSCRTTTPMCPATKCWPRLKLRWRRRELPLVR